MVGITGPLAVYFPSKQTASGLWFMSGFPGMLDYLLLRMVKMNLIDKQIEKNLLINTLTHGLEVPDVYLHFFLVYLNYYIPKIIKNLALLSLIVC